jgi:hypothetical protein
MLDDV